MLISQQANIKINYSIWRLLLEFMDIVSKLKNPLNTIYHLMLKILKDVKMKLQKHIIKQRKGRNNELLERRIKRV